MQIQDILCLLQTYELRYTHYPHRKIILNSKSQQVFYNLSIVCITITKRNLMQKGKLIYTELKYNNTCQSPKALEGK